MITLEKLKEFGADVKGAMERCLNSEDFYLKLVRMELEDPNVARLRDSLAAGDTKAAFEAAHALKGAMGNLGLTPITAPASELTELLRHPDGPVDTDKLLGEVMQKFDELKAMDE